MKDKKKILQDLVGKPIPADSRRGKILTEQARKRAKEEAKKKK